MKDSTVVADLLAVQIERARVSTERVESDVETLLEKIDRGLFIVQPPIQRGYVWNLKTASRLIESILLGFKMPEIQVARTPGENGILISKTIDGQQRCTTIYNYIKGINPWDPQKPFKLNGCETLTALNGLTFAELPQFLKGRVYSYRVGILAAETEDSAKIVDLFIRLNQSSWSLNPMEIRNAIYHSDLNVLLAELASDPDFLLLVHKKHDRRKETAELLLRFLAFHRSGAAGYAKTKNLKAFLDIEMEFWRTTYTKDIGVYLRSLFKQTIGLIREVFGDNAFSRSGSNKGSISKVLAELMFCGFASLDPDKVRAKKSEIREAIRDLCANNAEFINATVKSTSDVSRTLTRFDLWAKTLDQAMQSEQPAPAELPIEDCAPPRYTPGEVTHPDLRKPLEDALLQHATLCAACMTVIRPNQAMNAWFYVLDNGCFDYPKHGPGDCPTPAE